MDLETAMPAHFPLYFIPDWNKRCLITVDMLPGNIDTSADVDVHTIPAALCAVLQEMLPQILLPLIQKIDRLESQLHQALEDKQLLTVGHQLKLSQAEQKNVDLQAMQASEDTTEIQVVCHYMQAAMDNVPRAMPARFPLYLILNRYLITVDMLPENIDTSADVDVHSNSTASCAVLQKMVLQIQHPFKQKIDRLKSQLQQVLEEKQLLIIGYQLKLSQAEQKNAHLLAMQTERTSKNSPEKQVVHHFMQPAMNSAPQSNTNIKKQQSKEERQFKFAEKKVQDETEQLERGKHGT